MLGSALPGPPLHLVEYISNVFLFFQKHAYFLVPVASWTSKVVCARIFPLACPLPIVARSRRSAAKLRLQSGKRHG